MTFDLDLDFDTIYYDYLIPGGKLLFALSPIIFIAVVLIQSSEGEEEEKKKLAYGKTCAKSW